jgi:hypothetical protein
MTAEDKYAEFLEDENLQRDALWFDRDVSSEQLRQQMLN